MVIVYRHIEGGIKGYTGTERALIKTGKCAAVLHELDRPPGVGEMFDQVTGQIVPLPPTEEEINKSTLREQILAATEAQWLALTETQKQKIILKALKYVARSIR